MYSCLLCKNIKFNSRQFLYKHLIDHKKKSGCNKCDRILESKKKRRQHTKEHVQVKCQKCNEMYEEANMPEHIQFHNYLYSVDQLNGIVDIINEIQGNKSNSIRKTTDIIKYEGTKPNCPIKDCKRKFQTQNDLINHFIYHRNNNLCKFCKEIFPNNQTYEDHIMNKLCRYYSCLKCDKEFSFERFIRHITTECVNNLFDNMDIAEPIETHNTRKIYQIHDEIQYNFTCYICELEFNNLDLLNTHLKTHKKELNLCPKCFCVFDENQELKDHVLIGCEQEHLEQLNPDTRNQLKDEINFFLENLMKRRSHLDLNSKVYQIFGNVPFFQCHICNSKFVKFQFLKEHCEKFKHELILCYTCLYLFNTWDDLNKHYCVKLDYSSVSELDFRRHFQRCLKRKCEPDVGVLLMKKKQEEQEMNYYRNICNDDIIKRMNVLIKKLETTKFTDIKITEIFKETSIPICIGNSNDYYDLNKILPRIMERRNKRLLKKANPDEDSEEELEKIETNLHNLDIGKKHLLIENDEYDLDKVLPRIVERRNKRMYYADETIENISKFLNNFGYPENEDDYDDDDDDDEEEEPPNKKNRNDGESEDTADYLEEFERFIESQELSDCDEIPNKLSKYN